MADYVISGADLSAIANGLSSINKNLGTLNDNILTVDSNVATVGDNVRVVYDEIGALARDFHEFVRVQKMVAAKQDSQQELIKLNQELDKKFGHFDVVRRTTTGILQADDLAIVRKSTITTATEEMMITTPGYWLAPCLVALAAWINDQPELAEKAVREGLKRNDEKSSLFWALICRRADRKSAALKWTQRYLANQNEEDLDRKTVIILDAFASGLLGSDTEGVVSKQMSEWLERLSAKPGFVEQQTRQWSDAINLKRMPYSPSNYPYLSKYSRTWPVLKDIMEGAELHAAILGYFMDIFDREASTDTLKAQLDEILDSLVTDFDSEELPLRKQKKYHEFVVQFNGDVDQAKQHMALEESAFEEHKDFTQLLTDAAMKPESSHASISTQKFAIALSKDWISDAYNDVTAQNRRKIPPEIEINVDTFNDKTADGRDEPEIMRRFNAQIDAEKAKALSLVSLSGFEKFCLFGGIAILLIGIAALVYYFMGNSNALVKNELILVVIGLIASIAGLGMIINHFSKKNKVKSKRRDISDKFENKRQVGMQIVRATLAEIVDFRAEFAKKDAESRKVLEFLEQISPDQYVRKLADSNRRIRISD